MRFSRPLATQSNHAMPTDPPDEIAERVGARGDELFAPPAVVESKPVRFDPSPVKLVAATVPVTLIPVEVVANFVEEEVLPPAFAVTYLSSTLPC